MSDDLKSVEKNENNEENNAEKSSVNINADGDLLKNNAAAEDDKNLKEQPTDNAGQKQSYEFVNVSDGEKKIPEKSIRGEGKNGFVLLCLLFAVLTSLLFTPAFNIKTVTVSGNSALTAEQIVKNSGIVPGRNILRTNTKKAVKNLKKMPLINNVRVLLKFPASVEIAVEECVRSAYIKYMDKYVCIDQNGKILEVVKSAENESLIVVTGVVPTEFAAGKTVALKDADKLKTLCTLLSEIRAAAYLPNAVKSIDLSDKNKITMVLDNEITVNMGNDKSLQYKMAYLTKTLETQLKTYRGGTLDLSDPESSVRYKGSAE